MLLSLSYTRADFQPVDCIHSHKVTLIVNVTALLLSPSYACADYRPADFTEATEVVDFPSSMDPLLEAADLAVKASHPRGMRSRHFIKHVMSFLPYTKNFIEMRLKKIYVRATPEVPSQVATPALTSSHFHL